MKALFLQKGCREIYLMLKKNFAKHRKFLWRKEGGGTLAAKYDSEQKAPWSFARYSSQNNLNDSWQQVVTNYLTVCGKLWLDSRIMKTLIFQYWTVAVVDTICSDKGFRYKMALLLLLIWNDDLMPTCNDHRARWIFASS